MKIKVCGMADPENIERVCRLMPDFLGYIFYPGSRRYVGEHPPPELFTLPPNGIEKVGVFVNESLEYLVQTFEKHELDLVQLHGNESPEYAATLTSKRIPVIKVFDPTSADLTQQMEVFREYARFFLFDTPGVGFGGTGVKFDWSLLDSLNVSVPFLLSGGIGPDDAAAAKGITNNSMLGIDVNSRFETAPGMKDVEILEAFIRKIRK